MGRGGVEEGGAEEKGEEELKDLEILTSFYDEEILWLCKSLGGAKTAFRL